MLLGVVSFLQQREPERDDIAVSPSQAPAGVAPQLPRTVDVHCTRTGIDIPVASVRPQRDGLHVRVFNELAFETRVQVTAEDRWSSGWVTFEPGEWPLRLAAPPGGLTITCDIAGRFDRRTVELNDVDGHYQTPELVCPPDEVERVSDLDAGAPDELMVVATKAILKRHGYVDKTDMVDVGAVQGYAGARLGDPTVDPVVQVEQDGQTMAWVHLRRARGRPEGPWVTASLVEGCRSFLSPDPAPTDTTETTETTETTATTAP